MYTHVFITPKDAERLFNEFAREPLKEGQSGAFTHGNFHMHFSEFLQTYLDKLGAALEVVRSEGLYVLKFDHYLAHLPVKITGREIEPVKVEIVRFNSAPTKARAGYYEAPDKGFAATVERIVPHVNPNNTGRQLRLVYAQNLRVTGRTLKEAQDFNTKLSMGSLNRFLVNAFE